MPRGKSKHKRNINGMISSARCGAKTRKGTPCMSPAVSGKKRCRMHGGAKGSGAPIGNKNAYKTGAHTREIKEFKKQINKLLKEGREIIETSDQRIYKKVQNKTN